MSISPEVELGGVIDWYVSNIVLKKESRFTFWRNTAKSTHYIEKFFKKKHLSLKFLTKNLVGAYVNPHWVELRAPKIHMFKIL